MLPVLDGFYEAFQQHLRSDFRQNKGAPLLLRESRHLSIPDIAALERPFHGISQRSVRSKRQHKENLCFHARRFLRQSSLGSEKVPLSKILVDSKEEFKIVANLVTWMKAILVAQGPTK